MDITQKIFACFLKYQTTNFQNKADLERIDILGNENDMSKRFENMRFRYKLVPITFSLTSLLIFYSIQFIGLKV